jgi:hypothetical protein
LKQLQDAVLHAQETSNAFNDQVLSEHEIFRATKRHEMKALLGAFADGQIRMHKQSAAAWDRSVFSLFFFFFFSVPVLLLSLSLVFSSSLPLTFPRVWGREWNGMTMNGKKEAPQMD